MVTLVHRGACVNRAELTQQLRALGVRDGQLLLVHTSLSAVGCVAGGPAAVVGALTDAVGPEGTLVMPSMVGSRQTEPYDPRHTPTQGMGVVAESFWRGPGVVRSDHPTSAFAARGPLAELIAARQPLVPVHGPDSPVGRIYERGGSVLLLGVGHESNTTIHLAELMAEVPYRIPKWTTVLRNGKLQRIEFEEIDHCCRNFRIVDDWLAEAHLQIRGRIGQAAARLMRSRDLVDIVWRQLKDDPLRFLCRPNTGCDECAEARSSAHMRSASAGRHTEAG